MAINIRIGESVKLTAEESLSKTYSAIWKLE
jgi:hypothetical protein